jgi:predicted nucleic acid-binding Zn ribbon protein
VVYWSQAVGSQAAAATEAESVRDGILFVNTKSSVWSHELTLYKARILAELNRLLDGQNVRDIVFRVKRFKPEAPSETRDTPTLEELKAVQLEAAERAVLRGRLEDLIEIQDDNIRTKIATRLTLDAKLRHWRIVNGWKVCHACGTVHKTEYELCPICRLCR